MIPPIALGLAAVVANASLAAWFASALRDPASHVDLVYRVGVMVFVIEFLSLHSSGMLFGAASRAARPATRSHEAAGDAVGAWAASPARTGGRVAGRLHGALSVSARTRAALVAFYLVMVVGFAAATGQWIAAAYFAVSVVAKALSAGSVDAGTRLRPVAAGIALLLLSTFTVIVTAGWLARTFPLPDAVLAARPSDQGGLFVDTPQTLLAWGVIYFGAMTLYAAASLRLRRVSPA